MPFLIPRKSNWHLPGNIFQSWCNFNTAEYEDSLYPQFNIPFPESLANAVNKRKAEHFAGRYCAHNALNELGQEKFPTVEIGSHGSPQWPPGIKGSISHSRSWACAFVSTDPSIKGIGVDIEKVVDTGVLEESKHMILVAEELALLEQKNIDKKITFTLIFSLKESFFKAAYPSVGKYFDFDVLAVTHIDTSVCKVSFQLKESLHSELAVGATFEANYHWLEPGILATSVVLSNNSL